MQNIKLLGKDMAAGLLWGPLPSTIDAENKKYIEAISKEQSCNVRTLIKGDEYQVGLSSYNLNGKVPSYSIAAILFQIFSLREKIDNVAAIFDVGGDQYLYYAHRDNVILHNGDFLGSKEDVQSLLSSTIEQFGSFQKIFAPDDFGYEDASERTLASIIGANIWQLRRHVSLSSAGIRNIFPDKKKRAIKIAIVIGTAIFLMISFKAWTSYQLARTATKALEIQNQIAAQMAANAPKPAFQTSPNALEYTKACVDAIDKNEIRVPNWDVKSIICEGSAIKVDLQKNVYGRFEDAIDQFPSIIFDYAKSLATVIIPFESPKPQTDVQLREQKDVYQFVDVAIKHGIDLKIKSENGPNALPGQAPVQSQFKSHFWEITKAAMSPELAISILDMPGLRITRIEKSASAPDGAYLWTIEGILYAK